MDICQQEAIVRAGILLAIITKKNETVVRFKTVCFLQSSPMTARCYLLMFLQINKTSMDDILGKLPPELLNIVLSSLLPLHIKNLRLVNRKYHDASSHLLMRRVYFALRPKTLAVFKEIVEHPIFCRSVTEIVYDTSYFIDQRQRLSPDTSYFCRCFPERRLYSPEVVELADLEYRRLFLQQETIRTRSEDLNALRRASRMLVNLSSFVYTDWMILDNPLTLNNPIDDSESCAGHLIAEYKELDRWYLRDGPMSWDVKHGCLPTTMQVYSAGKISPVIQTMCGCDGSRPKIRDLTFTIHDSSRSLIRLWLFLAPLGRVGCCANLMRNLNTINISTGTRTTGTTTTQSQILGGLSKLLALAQQLRSLKLNSSSCPNPYIPSEEWQLLFPNSWPQLRSLDLSGFWHVNTIDLLEFLRRHSSTIKNLVLIDMYIVEESEESWIDFALQLQMALPRLHSLCLRKLSEAGDHAFKHLIYPGFEHAEILEVHEAFWSFDCGLRSKHLRLLENWILRAHWLPVMEKTALRQKVEDLRGPQGWHDFTQMGTFYSLSEIDSEIGTDDEDMGEEDAGAEGTNTEDEVAMTESAGS